MKFRIITTQKAFIFGFGWGDYNSSEFNSVHIIIGFIVIAIIWKKNYEK